MEQTISLSAHGHEHVCAEHTSTLEVTSDDFLTPAGDCIVGIEADTVPAEFSTDFVAMCQDPDAKITATIETSNYTATIEGTGHPDLTFQSDRSHVLRTSDYVDDRTVMVNADAAAADLDRDLVASLAGGADLTLRLEVDPA
jgi:hypothetical protein